jgi:hypothetical protein
VKRPTQQREAPQLAAFPLLGLLFPALGEDSHWHKPLGTKPCWSLHMQGRHEVQNFPCSYMHNKIDGLLISSVRECEIPRYVIHTEYHEVLKYVENRTLRLISRKILRQIWRDLSSVYDVTMYRVWNTEVRIDGGCEELSVDKHPQPPSHRCRIPDFY